MIGREGKWSKVEQKLLFSRRTGNNALYLAIIFYVASSYSFLFPILD